jgi:hypothetical protein
MRSVGVAWIFQKPIVAAKNMIAKICEYRRWAIFDSRIRVRDARSYSSPALHSLRSARAKLGSDGESQGMRDICGMSPDAAGAQLDPFGAAVVVAGVVFFRAQQFAVRSSKSEA